MWALPFWWKSGVPEKLPQVAISRADDAMGDLDDSSPGPGAALFLLQSATPATIIITVEVAEEQSGSSRLLDFHLV